MMFRVALDVAAMQGPCSQKGLAVNRHRHAGQVAQLRPPINIHYNYTMQLSAIEALGDQ
jgi:hypothetical protein